jgi:hypothetical protein
MSANEIHEVQLTADAAHTAYINNITLSLGCSPQSWWRHSCIATDNAARCAVLSPAPSRKKKSAILHPENKSSTFIWEHDISTTLKRVTFPKTVVFSVTAVRTSRLTHSTNYLSSQISANYQNSDQMQLSLVLKQYVQRDAAASYVMSWDLILCVFVCYITTKVIKICCNRRLCSIFFLWIRQYNGAPGDRCILKFGLHDSSPYKWRLLLITKKKKKT